MQYELFSKIMKGSMVPLKVYGIFLLILCSTMENLSGMTTIQSKCQTSRRKMPPPLVPDDSHILPITVHNVDNKQKRKYVSYWSPQQLRYVATLANQADFENNSPIMVPTSHVPVHHFKTIEKIALLLSTLESAGPEAQQEHIEEHFKTLKKSPRFLYKLWTAADYLDCPLVYDACRNCLAEKIKSHLDKNKITPALKLVDPKHGILTAYIAHHISTTYRPLRNFLIHATKQAYPHEEINDYWYRWARQETILFKTVGDATDPKIKCWFNGNIYTLPTKNKSAAYRTYICPTSGRFFCLFADRTLEAYDLSTSTFLGSCKTQDFLSAVCYSSNQKTLFLIDQHNLQKYSVEYDKNNSLQFKKNSSLALNSMKAFAFDETTGVFYIALESAQGIYTYDPTKNALEKYFFVHGKSVRRAFSSLCLSHNKKTLYSLSTRAYYKNNQKRHMIELCFWNIKKRKLVKVIPLRNYSPYHLLVSPDDSLVALEGYRKDKLMLHDATTGKKITILDNCSFPASFSQDSKTLATNTKRGFTEHILHDPLLEKTLANYSAEHIALLAACTKPRAPHNPSWNEMQNDIRRSEKTKPLLSELPQSLQKHLSQFLTAP